jgi:HD-GYP domain-containing protein (c-di-GMP phosphodiesterase class II)
MYPFPQKLAGFTAATATCFVAVIAIAGATHPAPSWRAFLVFGGLAIFSAQRQVRFSSVSLSPSFMVCMAAIVVFTNEHALAAAGVVGALSTIRIEHFAKDRWGWLPFNMSVTGLAFFTAAWVYAVVPADLRDTMPVALVGILLASAAYLVVALSLLILSDVVEGVCGWRESLNALLPFGLQVVPFAILGFLLGRLYLSLGPAVMLLIIVPILIAREMFASYMRVKESHEETVHMLIHALESKDHYTAGHAERVATYARYIGEELNFMPARLERLRFAALMHDIGKLVVPNHLLNKPARLTAEEFARVRAHEKVSVQMLSHIDFLRPIAGSGHSDNTRFNPDDTDHPIEPYIVMVADAYDAMTSTRAYRKALSQDVAFAELRDKSGTQFHPACVEALITTLEARGEKHGAGYEHQPEFINAPDIGLGSAGLGDLLAPGIA